MPVIVETRRQVGYSRSARIPVVTPKACSRTLSAITTSSIEQLPARSPMPLIVHSTWRAPARTADEAVGDRHAEVVVAVHRQRDRLDAAHVAAQVREGLVELLRRRVADGVRHVDRRRAGIDGGLHDLGEEIELRARGVLRRELDVVAEGTRMPHAFRPRGARSRSRAILSLCSRWIALVARKTCRRGFAAPWSADQAASMSARVQRASAQTTGPCTSRATAATDSQSPGDAAGNPASMMSTPSSASARATRSFSSRVMLQPGDCSPSRSVVSKIFTRSCMRMLPRKKETPQRPCRCGVSVSRLLRGLARRPAPRLGKQEKANQGDVRASCHGSRRVRSGHTTTPGRRLSIAERNPALRAGSNGPL